MMNRTRRLDSDLASLSRLWGGSRGHKLSRCEQTGLARYRDRHQPRQTIDARRVGEPRASLATYACPACNGDHISRTYAGPSLDAFQAVESAPAFVASLPTRAHRYVLFEVENPACGAQTSRAALAGLWRILQGQAPAFSVRDHIVIGADAPDGADRALLAAIDLHRVARHYDEFVIISGDHAFAPLARRAKKLEFRVHVVTAEHPEQRPSLARELAKATDDVLNTVELLRGRGIHVRSLSGGIDPAMSTDWLMLRMLDTLAEYQPELIIERVSDASLQLENQAPASGARPGT